jgi:cytoskeletal protein CcmA (bactofilin family)
MFSRNKNKNALPAGTPPRMVPSIISADLKITGNLESAGEIQVDGHVAGDIRAKILLVGSSAKVDGEIFAETLRVHGNVNGQITAKFVNLAKTARVIGDIHHENLSIQEGAFLEGRMVHIPAQAVKAEVPAAVATAQTPPQPVETASSDGKPAEDRVNLVVKSGKQDQPNKPVPTPPLSPPNSSAGKAAS